MEDKQLGVAFVRLASAIEDDGGERRCDVAHGKADDECACKYLIFLQRRCGHACESVSEGFLRVSAEICRDARVVRDASQEHKCCAQAGVRP